MNTPNIDNTGVASVVEQCTNLHRIFVMDNIENTKRNLKGKSIYYTFYCRGITTKPKIAIHPYQVVI